MSVERIQLADTNSNGKRREGFISPIEEEHYEGGLTVKDLQELFGVEPMTLWYWRRGSKKKSKLPSHSVPKGERHGVRFNLKEILEWAQDNKVWVNKDARCMRSPDQEAAQV